MLSCYQYKNLEPIIDAEVDKIAEWIIQKRREVHAHPELAHEEANTSKLVAEALREAGWEVHESLAGFGLLGTLRGELDSSEVPSTKCVAFRADMDALPINELTGAAYASTIPGKMHACGHDNHIAMALGIARVMAKLRKKWSGTIKLVFEPAEETGEGADMMIDAGVLDSPRVDVMITLAISPGTEEGHFRLIEGTSMPRVDRFRIEVEGEASHGGEPHHGIDAVLLGCELTVALQRVASREIPASDPVILNIIHIEGGQLDGTIPSTASLTGMLRSFSGASRDKAFQSIDKIVQGIAASYGGRASIFIEPESEYPMGYHDPAVTRLVAEAAIDVVGPDRVSIENRPDWGGDSFARYTQQVPGTFVFFGVRNEAQGKTYPVHHPKFDVDDSVLPIAVKVGCRAALRALV